MTIGELRGTNATRRLPTGRILPSAFNWRGPWRLVERNALASRRLWYLFMTGFAEPILFLLAMGIGVGKLVGGVQVGNTHVAYASFVAPGLMAVSAMNGAVFDTTINFFVKFKYSHTYDSVLATPIATRDLALGEILWALLRGTAYAAGFLITMLFFGVVHSWWAILAIPVAVLIGFAFAGAGLALTTYMRSFVDFDYVNLALVPMFMFSATFYPLNRYPEAAQWIVRFTPLYQGVAMERALTLGIVDWTFPVHGCYLAVMGAIGVSVANRRLGRLLQP